MIHENLIFGFGKKVVAIRQAEAAECGLACIAMVLSYYGKPVPLRELRTRFSVSLKGATLQDLSIIAKDLGLGFRALTLELDELRSLQVPCILHWDFNHFVVLTKVTKTHLHINDPEIGECKVSLSKASPSFTGVAVELWPDEGFSSAEPPATVRVSQLIGKVHGVLGAACQIIFLAICLEVLGLFAPLLMQWIMDYVIVGKDATLLITLAAGFGLLMLGQQLIMLLRAWALMYFNSVITVQWRSNLFSHLMTLPVDFFAKRHMGDVASKFGSIDQIQRVVTSSFLEGLLDGIFGILALIIMARYSVELAAITVLFLMAYIVVRVIFFSITKRSMYDTIISSAKVQSHFIESLRGIRTLKLFQREEIRSASWSSLLVEQVNADLRSQKIAMSFRFFKGVLFGIENILIVSLGAWLAIRQEFSPGAFVAYLAYKGQFFARSVSLIEKAFDLGILRLQGERLADIVLTEGEAAELPINSEKADDSAPSITFRDVSFRYGDTGPVILNGVSFEVGAGESVALVGPSGCGKSTIAAILLGIYSPFSGEILINGKSTKKIGKKRLRSQIGAVTQDDILFAGSIIDNITFFDQLADVEWAKQCARSASIAEEIESMPMKYNTFVGDMGTALSGGQKQRIFLARAFYRRPSILLLDEATSHLDLQNERAVNVAIKKMNITRVIIAHRPETIGSVDKVVSLLNGKVVSISMSQTSSPRAVKACASSDLDTSPLSAG